MTFKITFDLVLQRDIITGDLFLNGIKIDETDLSMLEAYDVKPNLDVTEKKDNKQINIIYELDINTLAFLKQKYYKN